MRVSEITILPHLSKKHKYRFFSASTLITAKKQMKIFNNVVSQPILEVVR